MITQADLSQPLASAVLYQVIYPAANRKAAKGVKYSLFPPDPWLLALAAVMWEGIVQGLAWDVIKATGEHLLATLQSQGFAPASTDGVTDTEGSFRYASFFADGRKKREIFVSLRRVYQSSDSAQRKAISQSFDEPRPSAADRSKRARTRGASGRKTAKRSR